MILRARGIRWPHRTPCRVACPVKSPPPLDQQHKRVGLGRHSLHGHLRAGDVRCSQSNSILSKVVPSNVCLVSSLHSQPRSWGIRIAFTIVFLAALAFAGFVGSEVGPHFKTASTSTTASTSPRPPSTTTSTVAHSSVRVLVANGTQEPNAAAHFTQLLHLQGWNVGAPKNTLSAVSSTTIYYGPGWQQAAALVASDLGVPTTAVQPLGAGVPVGSTTGLDIVVVIGSDLAASGFPATPATTGPTG